MKYLLTTIFSFFINISLLAEISHENFDKLFNVGTMKSYDNEFTLYFKSRKKSILARGERENYIKDYPQDLYIYFHETKRDLPLISYEWFPKEAKKITNFNTYPVFPEDFAYYLLQDNNTLVMINAKKQLKKNFEFNKIIPITGIIMTKLDGTAKGGILIAIAQKFRLPIIALGLGEKIDDLQIFDSSKFADAFLETN